MAEIKGRHEMAAVLAAAVRERQALPAEPLEIRFDREVLRLDRKTVQEPGNGPGGRGARTTARGRSSSGRS